MYFTLLNGAMLKEAATHCNKLYRVGEKSPYTDQYATIIRFESLTYALVTCPANPYVHLDAGQTNRCASISSVTEVGAFLD